MHRILCCLAAVSLALIPPLRAAERSTAEAPPAHRETDAEIKTAIIKGIVADPEVFATTLKVDVLLGKVILRGRVKSEAARRAAEEIATRAPGVRSVENNLVVTAVAE